MRAIVSELARAMRAAEAGAGDWAPNVQRASAGPFRGA